MRGKLILLPTTFQELMKIASTIFLMYVPTVKSAYLFKNTSNDFLLQIVCFLSLKVILYGIIVDCPM